LGPPAISPLTDEDRTIEHDPMRGGERTTLTDRQAWANKPDFAKAHPVTAERWKYQNPMAWDNSGTAFDYGRKARGWLQEPNALSNALNSGMLPGALAMGLGGGALALGGSWLKNKFSDKEHKTNTLRNTLMALILSGGAGAWLAHNRQKPTKYSSYMFGGAGSGKPDLKALAAQMIATVPGLSSNDKFQYMAATARLRDNDLEQLTRIIRGGGGALLGIALARFFFGKGVIPAAAGALLGGLSSGAFTNRGQRNMVGRDFNGNAHRIF